MFVIPLEVNQLPSECLLPVLLIMRIIFDLASCRVLCSGGRDNFVRGRRIRCLFTGYHSETLFFPLFFRLHGLEWGYHKLALQSPNCRIAE